MRGPCRHTEKNCKFSALYLPFGSGGVILYQHKDGSNIGKNFGGIVRPPVARPEGQF